MANQVRAFGQLKQASFDSDGKYYLTYNATYVDPSKHLVKSSDLVVTCDVLDGVVVLRTNIFDAIKSKGTELGFNVPASGVVMTDFVRS